jgi:hypothetical protein
MDRMLPSTRTTPSLGVLVVWWLDFLVRFGLSTAIRFSDGRGRMIATSQQIGSRPGRPSTTRIRVGPCRLRGRHSTDLVVATSGVRRRHRAVGSLGGAQHPAAAPLLRGGCRRRRACTASGHRDTVGRPVGWAARGRVLACRGHAAGDVLRELARSSRRQPTLRRSILGARQRAHRRRQLRRGLSQLPSPVPLRLPRRSSLVALRPEQVADLDARPMGLANGLRTASPATIAKAVHPVRWRCADIVGRVLSGIRVARRHPPGPGRSTRSRRGQ